jgi:conjugal transfer/type IV secretion protein DotA/TraY
MLMARLNNEVASLTAAQSSVTVGNYMRDIIVFTTQSDSIVRQSGSNASRGWFQGMNNFRDEIGMLNFEEASRIHQGFMAIFEDSTPQLAALGFQLSPENMASLMENSTNLESSLIAIPGLAQAIAEWTEAVLDWTSPSNAGADPMTGLVGTGNMILNITFLIVAVVTVGSLFTVGLAVAMLPVISVLLAAGGTLSYILPMMPFIYWVLAVTGYFLLIIEAVIAVNLWALAHMRMDGEGISGEAGRTGWLMLLALLMTPVLMIFGFLVGMTIFRVTSALLDIGVNQAITGIASGGILIQLTAIMVYAIMISMFYIVILERSFSLVSEFPGRVLRWIGAGAELTKGEEGRAQALAMATGAAIYKGGGAAAGIIGKSGGGRLGKYLTRDRGTTGEAEKPSG